MWTNRLGVIDARRRRPPHAAGGDGARAARRGRHAPVRDDPADAYRRDDRLVAITNGTMYHTVGRLERAGLLAEVGVDREGNRPERTTYAVTDAGREAVAEWVRRELPRVDHPAEFRIALAEAHNLDRDEVVALLRTRRDALAAAQAEHRRGPAGRRSPRACPTQYLLELEREGVAARRRTSSWLDRAHPATRGRGVPLGSATSPASAISNNERPHGYDRTAPRAAAASAHPPPTAPERSPWPALWALVIGFFMILVDTTIVSVANPAIKAALDPDTNNLDNVVWVTSRLPARVRGAAADHRAPRRPVRPEAHLPHRARRSSRSPPSAADSRARSNC